MSKLDYREECYMMRAMGLLGGGGTCSAANTASVTAQKRSSFVPSGWLNRILPVLASS